MGRGLWASQAVRTTLWPHWYYMKCLRCLKPHRAWMNYSSGPDVHVFNTHDHCAFYSRLLDVHASGTGKGRNFWEVRRCPRCHRVHGDWDYLTDAEYILETRNERSLPLEEEDSIPLATPCPQKKITCENSPEAGGTTKKNRRRTPPQYVMGPIVDSG